MAVNSFPVNAHATDDPEDEVLNEHVYDPGDPDGVVAAEKQRQWRETHPAPTHPPRTEHKPKRRWPKILIAAIVVIAAVVGAYLLGSHQVGKQPPAKTTAGSANKSNTAPAQYAPAQPKHYDSTNFSLGFDYPGNWTVSDTTSKLTITSPAISLMTAVGSKVNSHVVITIQNQQTSIAGFPSGGATAPLPSDLIKYTQPSTVQRAQTYLSYLSYTQPNGLDVLYLTGDKSYQQGQQVPMSDIVQGNPLIGVGFQNCSSGTCSGSSDFVTLLASSWKSTEASKDVTNILQSIVVNS